jgi:hypothetical protein
MRHPRETPVSVSLQTDMGRGHSGSRFDGNLIDAVTHAAPFGSAVCLSFPSLRFVLGDVQLAGLGPRRRGRCLVPVVAVQNVITGLLLHVLKSD